MYQNDIFYVRHKFKYSEGEKKTPNRLEIDCKSPNLSKVEKTKRVKHVGKGFKKEIEEAKINISCVKK